MLKKIDHDDGRIRELELNRPPANALDPELIRALGTEVKAAAEGPAEALILSGSTGMFSAGLDVPRLLRLDREAIRNVWLDYLELVRAIAGSAVPAVAAVTGHCPAGGAVLALFCDQRVMAEGDFRIGLNEVRLGLPVPSVIVAAVTRLVGAHQAERMCVRGLMLTGVEARAVGLVDRLAPAEDVVERSLAWCREVIALPRRAMLETRATARSGLHELLGEDPLPEAEALADRWFSDETQAALGELAARL